MGIFQIKDFFATYMITYMCSFVLYLLIEAPIGNLEKMIFMGNAPKKTGDTPAEAPAAANAQVEQVVTMESIQKKQPTPYDLKTVRL